MNAVGPAHTGLPIEDVVDDVRAALAGVGSAVLCAEPGAGKTTVVPLRLLGEGWLGDRTVLMLEPRRIAARAAAARMASLMNDEVGGLVGYRTRDDRRVSARTRVEVVTEGILTRRIQGDPELAGVGAVVFDEFHERNLVADLGLALALDVRASLRPDLRLLVMSATIDATSVAALVGGGDPAPIVDAEGRTHPVDVRWRPRNRRDRLEPAVTRAVDEALASDGGDVLVFLPGAGEIRRSAEAVSRAVAGDVDVRPLFGAMGAREQDAAIAPSPAGRRKVVLATDIAETSLTVEGVTSVVDAGLSREPRFDARTGMTRLVTVSASRDSADQRAGRAGRTAPGVAIRLWSKMEHGTRPRHRSPEITQVDLCGFVLETAAWGVTDPGELRLLDAPPSGALAEATALLEELGALDPDGRPTGLGRRMTTVGIHPRLARMILDAPSSDATLACIVAALVDERDVLRGRPDDLPVDIAERVWLVVDRSRRHPALDIAALNRVRERADDLARRAGISGGAVDVTRTGRVLALAYPDRVAAKRPTGVGRFLTVGGGGATVPGSDPLAVEPFIVAADLDGKRRDARVRMAAGLDADDVIADFGDRMAERTVLTWDADRDELTERVERRLGEIALDVVVRRPEPSPEVTAALVERVRRDGLDVLAWTDRSRRLRARAGFCRRHVGGDWPDMSDEALLAELDDWLVPHLDGVATWERLRRVDLATVVMTRVGWHRRRELDRLAPESVEVPSGRSVAVDYDADPPAIRVRVQEMFGATETPTVADGAVPLTLHLLSPADRPVQITSDLAGFWAGTWADVRKDMAGRYPKHAWPEDPTTVDPHRGPRRR